MTVLDGSFGSILSALFTDAGRTITSYDSGIYLSVAIYGSVLSVAS